MATGGTALVAIAFPNLAERSRAFGVLGVIAGVAMALGPTLGGFLASWLGWRWIFFANVPFCLALALVVPRLVAEANDREGRRLDLIGIALLTMSLGLAIDALLEARRAPCPPSLLPCCRHGIGVRIPVATMAQSAPGA